MSARRLCTLLAVLVLALLLANTSALSRLSGTRAETQGWYPADGPVGADPEDIDPEEGQFGDDDNWDRVAPGDPAAGGPTNSSGETRTTVTPDATDKEHARPSFSFRVQVRLMFRTWIIIVGLR